MENEEVGLTFGDIFHILWKKIWIVLIVSVAFAIVFFCVVQFWYNENQRKYVSTYSISFPGLNLGLYPDSSVYRIEDTISLEILNQIKEEADGAFDSIDIEKMIQKDGISISEQKVSNSKDTESEVLVTLVMDGVYFESKQQAQDFVREVAQYSIKHVQDIVEGITYDTYLNNYNSGLATSYEQKVNYLIAQQKYLLNFYDVMISSKGAYYTVSIQDENGTSVVQTLDSYRTNCLESFNETVQQAVLEELEVKGYIYDLTAYKQESVYRTEVLQGLVDRLDQEIAQLKVSREEFVEEGNQDLVTMVDNKIMKLTDDKIVCLVEMAQIVSNNKLTEQQNQDKNASFEARLNTCADLLKEQTEILQKVRVQFFEKESYFHMQKNQLEEGGGFSSLLAAFGGFIIGLLGVCIVICIVDYPKYKNQKNEKTLPAGDDSVKD